MPSNRTFEYERGKEESQELRYLAIADRKICHEHEAITGIALHTQVMSSWQDI